MGQLSRQQWITLILAFSNSALISLFPPYDYLSLDRGNVPTFAGFYWLFGNHSNHVINSNFLTLEFIVIMINAGIAWMLLNNKPEAGKKMQRYQRGVLWMVAINLTGDAVELTGTDHGVLAGRPVAVARNETWRSSSGLGHTTLIGATNGRCTVAFSVVGSDPITGPVGPNGMTGSCLANELHGSGASWGSEPIRNCRQAARCTP